MCPDLPADAGHQLSLYTVQQAPVACRHMNVVFLAWVNTVGQQPGWNVWQTVKLSLPWPSLTVPVQQMPHKSSTALHWQASTDTLTDRQARDRQLYGLARLNGADCCLPLCRYQSMLM